MELLTAQNAGVGQSTGSVLMVSPEGFGPDPETAHDNAFQRPADPDSDSIEAAALAEFFGVQTALQAAGIRIQTFPGQVGLPDGVFPNNWFTAHEDGSLVLYPMRATSRRGERRSDIVRWLSERYPQVLDLTGWEERERYLEGTGSLVLDHENRIAYAARSGRTDEQLVRNWCGDFEYEPVLFDTMGPGGKPVYHTNVLLAVGTSFAILCSEVILNPGPVVSALLSTGKDVIEITRSQMESYCGNVLELQGRNPIAVMSKTAEAAFQSFQLDAIRSQAEVVSTEIPTIERYGGGGIRCMLAELF